MTMGSKNNNGVQKTHLAKLFILNDFLKIIWTNDFLTMEIEYEKYFYFLPGTVVQN